MIKKSKPGRDTKNPAGEPAKPSDEELFGIFHAAVDSVAEKALLALQFALAVRDGKDSHVAVMAHLLTEEGKSTVNLFRSLSSDGMPTGIISRARLKSMPTREAEAEIRQNKLLWQLAHIVRKEATDAIINVMGDKRVMNELESVVGKVHSKRALEARTDLPRDTYKMLLGLYPGEKLPTKSRLDRAVADGILVFHKESDQYECVGTERRVKRSTLITAISRIKQS